MQDPTALPRRRAARGLLTLAGWPAAGGALSAIAAGCANPAAVPAPAGADPLPAPVLRVGDRWRYGAIDRYNGGAIGEPVHEVLAVAPQPSVRIDPGDGRREPAIERYADAWTVIAESTFDWPIVFERPMPVVPAGAGAGTSRRDATRYASPRSSRPLRWEQRLLVRGWERVRVPAGEFEALRIERLVNLEHADEFRLAAERTDRLWYAPRVNRWVLREWTGDYLWSGMIGRSARVREEWVRWELLAYEPAGR